MSPNRLGVASWIAIGGLVVGALWLGEGAIAVPQSSDVLAAGSAPNNVTNTYLSHIQHSLPQEWQMRLLPHRIPDRVGEGENSSVFFSSLPGSTTAVVLNLMGCEGAAEFCLVGSFWVDEASSPTALQLLHRHAEIGRPTALAGGVEGYLIEGSRLSEPTLFSSIVWQQNDHIYAIKALSRDRTNLLFTAANLSQNLSQELLPSGDRTRGPIAQVGRAPLASLGANPNRTHPRPPGS